MHLAARNVNLTDCICLMRYGKIFRGNKILNAENYGCAGALIFSDVADSAPLGEDTFVYANGYYRAHRVDISRYLS